MANFLPRLVGISYSTFGILYSDIGAPQASNHILPAMSLLFFSYDVLPTVLLHNSHTSVERVGGLLVASRSSVDFVEPSPAPCLALLFPTYSVPLPDPLCQPLFAYVGSGSRSL